jgi:Putative MetA-pathway of phenol degradation
MRSLLIAAFVLIGAGHAAEDNGSSSPINTDRPAVTDSSVVVPAGSLQFENGFEDAASDGLRTLDGPETLLCFGVGSKTELRLTTPDYFRESAGSSGFGDVTIGMKTAVRLNSRRLRCFADRIPQPAQWRSRDFELSRALSSNWTAAGMLSVYWPTEQGRRDVTGETMFLTDRQCGIRRRLPERGKPRHLAISEPLSSQPLTSSSICTWAWGFPRPLWITLSASATLSAYRCFDVRGVSCFRNIEPYDCIELPAHRHIALGP